jgi:hypothetical protein
MVLPLKVWPDDRAGESVSSQWVHTVDISPIGCRLGGLRSELSPGQTVTLQRGQQKALFRVIWSRQLGSSNETQAGAEAVHHGREIWAVELSTVATADESPTPSRAAKRSSTTLGSKLLEFVPNLFVSAAAPSKNKRVKDTTFLKGRRDLMFGLLVLDLILGLTLYLFSR